MVGAILAFWAACIIAFEIPSGLLADIFDRKALLIAAPLLKGACFVVWVLADGQIWMYFLGMALWSMASALRSGTKEALLFEHVTAHGRAPDYTSILGKERAFQEAATLSGAAAGGLIAAQNLELAFWLSLVPLSLCALSALPLSDLRKERRITQDTSFTRAPELIKTTWSEYMSKPEIRRVTLYVALCVTFLSTLEDFNQLFLLAIEMPVWSIGIAIAGMGLARLMLAYYASWFEHFPAFIWIGPLFCGGALFLSGFLSFAYSLLAMASAYILTAPLMVLTMSRFQKAFDGEGRATATSVLSVSMEALSLVFNIAIAILFSQLNVLKTYQICGAYLVVFALWEMARRPYRNAPI
ncbi:major facilitator family transporter [Hyphomonas hirschiana VP5]|nr:major facilitator family transporter [Hyphomonas hirschiana VP5]